MKILQLLKLTKKRKKLFSHFIAKVSSSHTSNEERNEFRSNLI